MNLFRFVSVLVCLLAAGRCLGATFTWTKLVAGNASGAWTNQANWTGGTLPTTNTDAVDFGSLDPTVDSTVTLDGNQTLNALVFGDTATATTASWTIAPGTPAGSALTLGGTNPTITVNALGTGEAALISAVVAGTNGLTKGGTGFLRLAAANTYSGGTVLSGSDCRLSVGHDRALGAGRVTVGATVGAGQVWFQPAGNRTLTNDFEIRSIRWIIDGNTAGGAVAGDLVVSGNVSLNTGASGVRDLYCNRNLTLNGNVTVTPASNPMNKQGGYLLTLNGTNTVGGASAVNAGTLVVNGLMNGNATFTVNSGGTLGGTGNFSGAIVVANGGTLQPGTSGSGTLTCGGLTCNATSQFNLDLGAANNPSNGMFRVNGNLTLDGTLNVSDLGGFGVGVYTNFYYSGTLVNNGLTVLGVPAGKTAVVDTATPNYVLLRVLAGQLSPSVGESVPMSLADPLGLSWVEVAGAVAYDVFLGTASNSVFNATSNTPGIYQGRTAGLAFNVTNLQPNTTYYWRVDGIAANGTSTKGAVFMFTTGSPMVDLMMDTWVATDALNRTLPGHAESGAPRGDRPVGIFYFLWHTTNGLGNDGPRDNTQEIQRLGGYTDPHNPWADNPLWMSGANARSWYWGEPEFGYYGNDDEWVIRRHIAMLEAAGVDVLGFDTTNGSPWNHEPKYLKILAVIRKMQLEGTPVRLKIFHYTHGGVGGSPNTVTWLYDHFYKPGLYRDLWFTWQGKPLIIGYPNGLAGDGSTPVTSEVLNFFTWKTGWAYVSTTLSNEWQWIDTPTRQNFGYSGRTDIPEQLPVTCGGWANGNLGRSYANSVQPGYDNYHLTTNRTEGLGIQFSEQAFQGRKVDPQFMWVTGWNEWWAGAWDAPTACYTRLLADCTPINKRYFVDNYNAEYSRDIEPMKGGFTDNYYYQLVALNRLRKGTRSLPMASAQTTINLTGDFSDWSEVSPEFRDVLGETLARNHPSTFGNLPNYTNNTGRNDFTLLKVARDATYVYFLAQCRSNLSSYTGSNWMNLFLDVDRARATGWEGYDFAVNLGVRTATTTTLSKNTGTNWNWTTVRSDIAYKVTANQLMLAIPRVSLGLTNEPFAIDFHWADNFQTNDISGFFLYGDSAPDRRFNYRYQTAVGPTVTLRQDDFDSGKQSFWDESWTNGSKWNVTTTGSYRGGCAVASTTNGTNQSTLITRADTRGLESLRVSFRYKLANVLDAQNLNVQFNGTNGWVTMQDLGRDQYYPSGQAWGYDERQNVWLLYTVALANAGTNAKFFHTNFAVRIDASGITTNKQAASIDDFQITGVAVPNQTPVLAAVSNRTLVAGQTLLITNLATDADIPAQTLTWNLVSAPTNASVDPTSGLFTWRPLIGQSPSTNLVVLRVTDSGSPPLSATQSFSVVVIRPAAPVISAATISNGVFGVTIAGDHGPDYGLYASTNLVDWLLLLQTNPPVLPFNLLDPGAIDFNRRFYRVQLLP